MVSEIFASSAISNIQEVTQVLRVQHKHFLRCSAGAVDMEHGRRVEEHVAHGQDIHSVFQVQVVGSNREAKALLGEAYIQCLSSATCHSKIRGDCRENDARKELVKLLMCKTNAPGCENAYKLCLSLWDTLSAALTSEEEGCCVNWMPSREAVSEREDKKPLLRLGLMAHFYRYLSRNLGFNTPQHVTQLRRVREVGRLLCLGSAPPSQSSSKRGMSSKSRASKHWGIKWHALSFVKRKLSYHNRLMKAFQTVKQVGYVGLAKSDLESKLSCYFRLVMTYTTDSPLELAGAYMPWLKPAVELINREDFAELSKCDEHVLTALYAVLNCHMNWIRPACEQVLLVPGQPMGKPLIGEGDLRCVRCLKNQTFRSSEVRGNPKNIDVEFDIDRMTFASSCCGVSVIYVPLCTNSVNTLTFTDMKQVYTTCPSCKRAVFSELLVDYTTLISRCVCHMGKSFSEGDPLM